MTDDVKITCIDCSVELTEHNWYGWHKKYIRPDGKRQRHARRCKICWNVKQRSDVAALRKAIIIEYGGLCTCCGETDWRFLTIDHINKNGAEERKTLLNRNGNPVNSGGYHFYRWLKRNGYPKEGYQVLCFNCNCAKGIFGFCPHQTDIEKYGYAYGTNKLLEPYLDNMVYER